ncbi:MAG: sigma 54-interacting transcriptional regulator [Acidaminobacteraceae bacterium]
MILDEKKGCDHIFTELEFYKSILECSHDEIYVTDGKGIAIYCNKKFEENYGMKRDEIIGKHTNYLIENGYCDVTAIDVVLRKKERVTIRQKTHVGRELLVTATPEFDEHGEIRIIVENCRDVTELVMVKDTLKNTHEQMIKYMSEIEELRRHEMDDVEQMIYTGDIMGKTMKLIDRLNSTNPTILITGESGTGKSFLAKYIHKSSTRRDSPFISLNCTTIPENLFESELFGYSGGAFTGALKGGKVGLVELANNGTLFLDEIGEISIALQAKLLELIQDKKYKPVGANEYRKVDIRIVAATNANLEELVNSGHFRKDLFYRLKVIEIDMPPLRERSEDIFGLVNHFVAKFNSFYKTEKHMNEAAIEILKNHSWPGNIRELQHLIEQLILTSTDDEIKEYELPITIQNVAIEKLSEEFDTLDGAIATIEKSVIINAYSKYNSSYIVADKLKISQSRATRLIRKYKNEHSL